MYCMHSCKNGGLTRTKICLKYGRKIQCKRKSNTVKMKKPVSLNTKDLVDRQTKDIYMFMPKTRKRLKQTAECFNLN